MEVCPTLEDLSIIYVVKHLGRFPFDVLQRLPNSLRYRILHFLPVVAIWRMEATPFVRGLDMEIVWKQLLEERYSPQKTFPTHPWCCSKGTERCLNSSHDRGTMASFGFPFLHHECVTSCADTTGACVQANVLRLSSRSLYFLNIWKIIYSAVSLAENQELITKVLFSPYLNPLSLSTSASHRLLFDLLHIPSELIHAHDLPTSPLPTTNYSCYVNTLLSFLSLECCIRPKVLFVNPSYSFLKHQSVGVLQDLLCDIEILSFEYSSTDRCILEAALHNCDHYLLLAIRGSGAATHLVESVKICDKLKLEYFFSGRSTSEPELTRLVATLSHNIVSLDIAFHTLLQPCFQLALQCLCLVQQPHIERLCLNGVLNATFTKEIITKYLNTPCSAPQRLELRGISNNIAKECFVQTNNEIHNEYWKHKSLYICNETSNVTSWIFSLPHCSIYSLEIIDCTANFDDAVFFQTIQVQKFTLTLSAAYKTLDSSAFGKILMTVANPNLQYLNVSTNCKFSTGASVIIEYLTQFLKLHSKSGILMQLHVVIQSIDKIDSDVLFDFFVSLFCVSFIAELDFKLDCGKCSCNHSVALAAWNQVGKHPPAHFYFRNSIVEWKMLPHSEQ